MNNLEWLCNNDRDRLIDALTNDSCRVCPHDGKFPDCPGDCDKNISEWLMAEHQDVTQSDESDGTSNKTGEDVMDSREKIGADMRDLLWDAHFKAWMWGHEDRRGTSFRKLEPKFFALLDRQAAITRAECMGGFDGFLEARVQERIDEMHDHYRDERDSREKLLEEANGYVVSWWHSDWVDTFEHANTMKRDVIHLLDRQAAITERDMQTTIDYAERCRETTLKQFNELYVENSELQARVDELQAKLDAAWDAYNAYNQESVGKMREISGERDRFKDMWLDMCWHSGCQRRELANLNAMLFGCPKRYRSTYPVGKDGRRIQRGQTLYGNDGKAWKVERFDGKYLWTDDDEKRLLPEWLSHEKPDSSERIVCDMRDDLVAKRVVDVDGYVNRIEKLKDQS